MGTRESIARSEPRTTSAQVFHRTGKPTIAEEQFVAQLVADQPREMSTKQITGLSLALRRPRHLIKEMVERAKDNLVSRAERYVDIHMEAAEAALASGTVAGMELASKSAQWAMENINVDGARVIDPPTKGDTSPRVWVGVKIGGMSVGTEQPVTTEVSEVPPSE